MSVIENSKVTVVGAGAVGSSVAYAALIRGSARHVALYDIATEKVEAEVLDLSHGSQFTGSSDIIGGSDISVAAAKSVTGQASSGSDVRVRGKPVVQVDKSSGAHLVVKE